MLSETAVKNPVICLMGPTAAGKTDLAAKLAEQFSFEIISVDSAMVYRGMDIGTAKPDRNILAHIPHYLIDICNLDETYSAGRFCKDAVEAIFQIENNQHIPLLTGGTMLYFRALQQGLSELPVADPKIREKINLEALQYGWDILYEKLHNIDPVTAKRLHSHDTQRIQRALEVYEITGIPLSQWHYHQEKYLKNHQIINIGLIPNDREKLKIRIAERFHQMLDMGLIDEVKKLWIFKDTPAMRSVGYRQVCEYLSGKYNENTMIEKAIIATQQLARRQMTWLRSFPDVTFFDSESSTVFEEVLQFLRVQNI